MERQFKATCDRNTQLAQDLGAAKKEIEILKGKLKELEVGPGEIKCYCNYLKFITLNPQMLNIFSKMYKIQIDQIFKADL